jgi:hypothetical protein
MKLKRTVKNPETGKANHYLPDMRGKNSRRAKEFRLDETKFTDGTSKYAQHYLQVNQDVVDVFQQSRSENVLHTTAVNVLHTLNNEMIPVKEGSYEHKIPIKLAA